MSPFDLLKVNLVFKATLTRGRVKSGKEKKINIVFPIGIDRIVIHLMNALLN